MGNSWAVDIGTVKFSITITVSSLNQPLQRCLTFSFYCFRDYRYSALLSLFRDPRFTTTALVVPFSLTFISWLIIKKENVAAEFTSMYSVFWKFTFIVYILSMVLVASVSYFWYIIIALSKLIKVTCVSRSSLCFSQTCSTKRLLC